MSKKPELIEYQLLNHLIVPLGALNSPSELHGMLCGKLAGGQEMTSDEWLVEAFSFLDLIVDDDGQLSGDEGEKAKIEIARLFPVVESQLEDDELGVQLLVPDDEESLSDRLRAIAQWSHGFLTGFGSAGMRAEAKIPEDCAEAIRNIAAIVSIDDDVEADEDGERDYMALVEYVRMAVLALYYEFGRENPEPVEDTIH